MSKKPILTNAKFKTFPHIEEKTGEKIKVKDLSGKTKRVDKIRIVNLEEYIRKILLQRGRTEGIILDRDAEKKELERKLNDLDSDEYNIFTKESLKNRRDEIYKEHEEKMKTKIDISELLHIINKDYSEKTAIVNKFKSQIKVFDGTKRKYIEDAQNAVQKLLERETNKKERKKISGMIAKLKTLNYEIKSGSSTMMINKLSLDLFEYLDGKLQGKYFKDVVIHGIIFDLLKTVVEDDEINKQTVKDFIKNARTKKS
jgi:hypothetical protein